MMLGMTSLMTSIRNISSIIKSLSGLKRTGYQTANTANQSLIKGGIPAIILCNPGPDSSYRDYLDRADKQALRDWTENNAKFVFISEPLYEETNRAFSSEAENHGSQSHTQETYPTRSNNSEETFPRVARRGRWI